MRQEIKESWKFHLGDVQEAYLPDYNDLSWEDVFLPHDWQINQIRNQDIPRGGSQGYFEHAGIGWYRYHFNISEDLKGKIIRILFDGVQRFSTVWLNGEKLGEQPYGYVPFQFEIQDMLHYDRENILAVRVDNSIDTGDRWYSGEGIYRKVFLCIEEPVHVQPQNIKLTTEYLGHDDWKVHAEVLFENHGDTEVAVRVPFQVKNRETGTVLSETTDEVVIQASAVCQKKIDFLLHCPPVWNIDSPNMCCFNIHLFNETLDIPFGIREIYFDGDKGFFLNRVNYKLKGVNLHHDCGCVGAAVPETLWRRRLEKLKALGCNAIRCSHNPQAEEFYKITDEMGFLVIDELYDKWAPSKLYFDKFYDQWWEKDLEAMINRDFNHPSIILWSVGNEIEYQYEELFYENAQKMCQKVRELDGSRAVSFALMPYCFENYNDDAPMEHRLKATLRCAEIADVLMLNYMESFYKDLKEAGLKKAIIGSEVYTGYRSVEHQFMQIEKVSPYRDVEENDFVAGSFIWAGIDYLGESTGWPCRGWSGSLLDSAGFEKIRAWYLASQWKKEPFIKLAVMDEHEPWDMANNNWGFPQMRRHWNYMQKEKIMHVVAFTNCRKVQLFLNDEPVRVAQVSEDGMTHFYLPYREGKVCAKVENGGCFATDELHTAKPDLHMEVQWYKGDDDDILQAEIWLLDEYNQPWTQDNFQVNLTVEGGKIIAVDNGDFLTTKETYRQGGRSFFNGHILTVIQPDVKYPNVILTVAADALSSVQSSPDRT